MATLCPLPDARASEPPGVSPIAIHAAQACDVLALMYLKYRMLAAEGLDIAWLGTPADWLRDGFGAEPRFAAFLAEDGPDPVGMIICNDRRVMGWPKPTVYIQDVYVTPEYRGRGIGRTLLAQVAAYAQTRDAAFIELNVSADNPARSLYARSGFTAAPQCLVYLLTGQAFQQLATNGQEDRVR